MSDEGQNPVAEPSTPYDRYVAAMRSLESWVAVKARMEPAETNPQQLRIGVNSSLLQHSALVQLLADKGLITEDEFLVAMANAAEQEVARYQQWISTATGVEVSLK